MNLYLLLNIACRKLQWTCIFFCFCFQDEEVWHLKCVTADVLIRSRVWLYQPIRLRISYKWSCFTWVHHTRSSVLDLSDNRALGHGTSMCSIYVLQLQIVSFWLSFCFMAELQMKLSFDPIQNILSVDYCISGNTAEVAHQLL